MIALFLAYVDAEREKYSGMPLGDAIADAFAAYKQLSEAERQGLQLRVARGLGRLEQKAYQAENNSRSGSERAAQWPEAQFNCRVERALAEVTLPTKRGERVRAAVKHLKVNHLHLWDATAPGAAGPVRRSTKTAWFRERMRLSQHMQVSQSESVTRRVADNGR